MKKIIFLIFFLLCQNIVYSKEMILDQLKNPKITNQSQKWNFITDQVMGGVSTGKFIVEKVDGEMCYRICLLYTSPSPRDVNRSRMPSSA